VIGLKSAGIQKGQKAAIAINKTRKKKDGDDKKPPLRTSLRLRRRQLLRRKLLRRRLHPRRRKETKIQMKTQANAALNVWKNLTYVMKNSTVHTVWQTYESFGTITGTRNFVKFWS
jgi:hypothetical protein